MLHSNSSVFKSPIIPLHYSNTKGTLIHADCMKVLPLIKDNSVNLILADLPYGVTKNKWDSVIDLEKLWKEYKRISNTIILFGQDKFTAKLILSNEKWHRYNLVWDKGNRGSGFLNAKRRPLRNHEDILVFYSKLPTYNPQFTEGEPLHGMGEKYKEGKLGNNNYGKFDSHKNPSALRTGDTKKYPKSILRFDKPHPPIHPTEKPVELMKYLINTFTNENDLVLDNTMGAGATCVAAQALNRNFIGIEKRKIFFNLSSERCGFFHV